MNIALYGGSFNPIHKAHERTIQILSNEFDLVIIIPAKKHAFKGEINSISDRHRLELIEISVKNLSNVVISDFELTKSQSGYMIESVLFFKEKYTDSGLSLVIGADNLQLFSGWVRWEELLTLSSLYVIPRPNVTLELPQSLTKYFSKMHFAKQSEMSISSTEIRKRLSVGDTIEHLVSKGVSDYIYKNNVYQ